jgi:hypothetical protein
MKAIDIEKYGVISIDGGQTWLVVVTEPKDTEDDKISFQASLRDEPTLRNWREVKLHAYDHVWEPDPIALNRGDDFLPVKEE